MRAGNSPATEGTPDRLPSDGLRISPPGRPEPVKATGEPVTVARCSKGWSAWTVKADTEVKLGGPVTEVMEGKVGMGFWLSKAAWIHSGDLAALAKRSSSILEGTSPWPKIQSCPRISGPVEPGVKFSVST